MKKILLVLMSVAVLFSLIACGNVNTSEKSDDNSTIEPTATLSEREKYELELKEEAEWAIYDHLRVKGYDYVGSPVIKITSINKNDIRKDNDEVHGIATVTDEYDYEYKATFDVEFEFNEEENEPEVIRIRCDTPKRKE